MTNRNLGGLNPGSGAADESVSEGLVPEAGRVLVMLAKPPEPGRVKTRLCGSGGITAEDAARVHGACVADLAERLGLGSSWRMVVCPPPGDGLRRLAELLPDGVPLWPEPPGDDDRGDFGAAMVRIAGAWLNQGARKVVLIGGDCPHLPTQRVEQAFDSLAGRDLVLGPDDGGGCYLIGMRRRLTILTEECGLAPIAWSQGTDYRELVRRASAHGVSVGHLPPTYDLDRPDDLRRLRGELANGVCRREHLPRTAAELSAIWP